MYQIYAYCFILHRIKTMFPKKKNFHPTKETIKNKKIQPKE